MVLDVRPARWSDLARFKTHPHYPDVQKDLWRGLGIALGTVLQDGWAISFNGRVVMLLGIVRCYAWAIVDGDAPAGATLRTLRRIRYILHQHCMMFGDPAIYAHIDTAYETGVRCARLAGFTPTGRTEYGLDLWKWTPENAHVL